MQDQKEYALAATDSAWQSRLASRVSSALDSLSCADMAVAALESAQGHPDAAIWAAIDGGHPSIRPALALSEAEVRTVATTWHAVAGASFSGAAAAATWVSCFQVSRNLRQGYISILLQVPPPPAQESYMPRMHHPTPPWHCHNCTAEPQLPHFSSMAEP